MKSFGKAESFASYYLQILYHQTPVQVFSGKIQFQAFQQVDQNMRNDLNSLRLILLNELYLNMLDFVLRSHALPSALALSVLSCLTN